MELTIIQTGQTVEVDAELVSRARQTMEGKLALCYSHSLRDALWELNQGRTISTPTDPARVHKSLKTETYYNPRQGTLNHA